VPAVQSGIPGASLFVSPPSQNQVARSRPKGKQGSEPTPSRSGVLGAPPFHIGTGAGPLDTILAILVYGTLGLGAAVLLAYLVRFWRGSRGF
jgi:hypothetical protein